MTLSAEDTLYFTSCSYYIFCFTFFWCMWMPSLKKLLRYVYKLCPRVVIRCVSWGCHFLWLSYISFWCVSLKAFFHWQFSQKQKSGIAVRRLCLFLKVWIRKHYYKQHLLCFFNGGCERVSGCVASPIYIQLKSSLPSYLNYMHVLLYMVICNIIIGITFKSL